MPPNIGLSPTGAARSGPGCNGVALLYGDVACPFLEVAAMDMWIDGDWASRPGTRDLVNPANGVVHASVSDGGPESVQKAVAAAVAAGRGSWRDTLGSERAGILLRLADLVEANAVELATLEFGAVWINDHLPIASEMPHGGVKQSGFGKDMSDESVLGHTVTKHIMLKHAPTTAPEGFRPA